uniref:Liver-expressed antimicrobial peptide 2 n=1 Tax=Aquila chrysaetos chrysaetos TaxID=223781 RepID=A0A663EIK9_AQUCH
MDAPQRRWQPPAGGGEGGAGGDKGLSRHLGPLKYLCRAVTGEEQCPAEAPDGGIDGTMAPRGSGGHAAPRLPRMTPFWRMVGSRPLGAHCRHSLECVTRACRARRCAPPQYEC